MKKSIKSLLTVLFTAALLVNIVPVYAGATEATATVAPTAAATDAAATEATATVAPTEAAYVAPAEWTALIMYSAAAGDWEIYDPQEGKNTVAFVGDGIYEITLKGADIGATGQAETPQVFLIDIQNFVPALQAMGKTYQNYSDKAESHDPANHNQPTDLTIKLKVSVDGQDVRVKNDNLNYGDIEEKGNFRIEIFNIWGLHGAANVENPAIMPEALLPESEIKVQFTIQGTGYNTEAGAAQIAAANPTPTTAATAAPVADTTDSSSTDTASDSSEDSSNTGLIIGIIAAVVVGGVVIVLATKKKKK